MCIIICKGAGVVMPDVATLERCFTRNPDGAGFMYQTEDGQVAVIKGLMTFKEFWETLSDLGDLTPTPVVIHFRIGTQGARDHTNCHPFPVTTDDKKLEAKMSCAHLALAHNGVIPLTSKGYHPGARSDTFVFVRDYASDIITSKGWWRVPAKKRLLERLASSKLAILGGDGHIERIGDFIEEGGCYFSNASFRAPAPVEYHAKVSYWPSNGGRTVRHYGGYGELWGDYLDSLDEARPDSGAGGTTQRESDSDFSGRERVRGTEDDKPYILTSARIPVLRDLAIIPATLKLRDRETRTEFQVDGEQFLYDDGGNVYWLDIDPDSPTFRQVVRMHNYIVVDDKGRAQFAEMVDLEPFEVAV